MEDNKLIAEFMGALGTPKYSPVIEECKATNVHPKMPTIMQSTLTLILDEIDALMIGHWGIELTYKEVVKFITKYNEYKTHTT